MIFTEAPKIGAHIDQLARQKMENPVLALQRAAHAEEPYRNHGSAIALQFRQNSPKPIEAKCFTYGYASP
jgi:hypothetical protein